MSATKYVFWITASSKTMCEILVAQSGADVILIDAQHGAFGPDEAFLLVSSCAAMCCSLTSNNKIECAVRVSDYQAEAEICRYLDAGATTIVCPMVNNKTSCEKFVNSCYYPPTGLRSYGPYRHRILFDNFTSSAANNRVVSLAMIETKEAYENLEDILSVPNLSGIFIGPNDLALSLGYPPSSSPTGKVLEAVLKIGKRARELNKVAGIFCSDLQTAQFMSESGFNFVVFANDIGVLLKAVQASVSSMKKESRL